MASENHHSSLIFYHSVPKLSNIVSSNIASLLWRRKIIAEYPWERNAHSDSRATLRLHRMHRITPLQIEDWDDSQSVDSLDDDFDLLSFPMRKQAPRIHQLADELMLDGGSVFCDIVRPFRNEVPNEVYQMIERSVIQMASELWTWIYCHCNVFVNHTTLEIIFVHCLDNFVWYTDGTLCHEETAKNLIKSSKLDDFDKFSVACEYCMEAEIRRLWPWVQLDNRIREIRYPQQDMLYYWKYNLKNKLYKVPARETIIETKPFHNALSLEYFWQFLNPDERVLKISQMISNTPECVPALLCILPKLKDEELNELILTKGSDLMMSVIETMCRPLYIFQVWSLMKDIISCDQFYTIFLLIFKHECEICASTNFNYEFYYEFERIWTSAPDRLKQHALTALVSDASTFFQFYRKFTPKKLARPMNFLTFVLKDAPYEQRKLIWQDGWRDLIYGVNPRYLKKLMEVCLDENDIVKFKESEFMYFLNLKDYCMLLLANSCVNELEIFLDFCASSNPEKKRFLVDHAIRAWHDITLGRLNVSTRGWE